MLRKSITLMEHLSILSAGPEKIRRLVAAFGIGFRHMNVRPKRPTKPIYQVKESGK
jgi:hypothetical protein